MKKIILCAAIASLTACGGDDGSNGANGRQGVDGVNGNNGNNGLNTLVNTIVLEQGNANCPMGGAQLDSGLDANSNGTLEAGEVTSTSYSCLPFEPSEDINVLTNTTENAWFKAAKTDVEAGQAYTATRGSAKNIILFVGDGMGVSTVTAARILDGQGKGMMGEENSLSFGKFPFTGLAKTYNVDAQTPDSAGTMTAMMTGVKTDVGVIGVNENIVRGDCTTAAGNELVTALELAEIAGMSTGVISTARITHATPAAAYAKSPDRNWEDISDIEGDAVKVIANEKYEGNEALVTAEDMEEYFAPGGDFANCEDIASQLVNFEKNLEARFEGVNVDGLEVVMGGGRRHFLPKDESANSDDAVSEKEGDRTDGRNLVTEWAETYPEGEYVFKRDEFNKINTDEVSHLFGLFNESHMHYEADRFKDISGEPSLSEMTAKAIDILDNNDKGYFLTVEAGRIDHGHHAGSAYNALTDAIEFSRAVQAAVDAADEDTLILVTADHSHVFTIAGYPKRGNPILGKVVAVGSDAPALAADGMPYTTLGYTNGLGFRNLGSETDADKGYDFPAHAGRVDLGAVDTQTPGFHQEALVPRSSETHAGEDVGIYAMGPGASLVTGTNEQNMIFHIMEFAGDLSNKADNAVQVVAPE